LDRRADIHTVEVVFSGRKTDSQFLAHDAKETAPGIAVIIAATGGYLGQSLRNYLPRTELIAEGKEKETNAK